jgi:hypothetical protein
MLIVLLPAAALAAPTSKTAICHFDKTLNTYTLIQVKNGVAAHLAHGDVLPGTGGLDSTCAPTHQVLARAWTDLDANAEYNADQDVLIAELQDTNDDTVVSAGDTVRLNRYPLDFTGTTFGTFGVTSFVASAVITNTSSLIVVQTTPTNNIRFTVLGYEAFQESADQYPGVQFFDKVSDFSGDEIVVDTAAHSAPDTAVSPASGTAPTLDQSWLEVQIGS